jgi:cell division protein FtsQ
MEETLNLMDVLEFIYKDEFWKAQITEIEIQRNGDLILYTQVSRQYVEFGKPEIVENKFARLKIFYKDILPRKGWNVYERVNLKFKDQIICE